MAFMDEASGFWFQYPSINPVLIELPRIGSENFGFGPFPIRWYALAYVCGLMIGWWVVRALVRDRARWGNIRVPTLVEVDDLLVYVALGVILGGRLGYVLVYDHDKFLSQPWEILKLWEGGMSFHGGAVGALLGVLIFAARHKTEYSALTIADICCVPAPIGLFFGRIANFIKPELWGRPTDVPWALVFPGSDGRPRHPSQLYEAFGEGILLFLLMVWAVRAGALRRPGLVTGLFTAGYGIARISGETFREPDIQMGFYTGGTTMGMLLSIPMVCAGAYLIWQAMQPKKSA